MVSGRGSISLRTTVGWTRAQATISSDPSSSSSVAATTSGIPAAEAKLAAVEVEIAELKAKIAAVESGKAFSDLGIEERRNLDLKETLLLKLRDEENILLRQLSTYVKGLRLSSLFPLIFFQLTFKYFPCTSLPPPPLVSLFDLTISLLLFSSFSLVLTHSQVTYRTYSILQINCR